MSLGTMNPIEEKQDLQSFQKTFVDGLQKDEVAYRNRQH